MKKTLSDIEAVERVYLKYPSLLKEAEKEYKKVCLKRNDILHTIELGSLNAIQLSKLTKELKSTLITRRKLKNKIEVLKHVYTLANHPNKPNKQRINTAIG